MLNFGSDFLEGVLIIAIQANFYDDVISKNRQHGCLFGFKLWLQDCIARIQEPS